MARGRRRTRPPGSLRGGCLSQSCQWSIGSTPARRDQDPLEEVVAGIARGAGRSRGQARRNPRFPVGSDHSVTGHRRTIVSATSSPPSMWSNSCPASWRGRCQRRRADGVDRRLRLWSCDGRVCLHFRDQGRAERPMFGARRASNGAEVPSHTRPARTGVTAFAAGNIAAAEPVRLPRTAVGNRFPRRPFRRGLRHQTGTQLRTRLTTSRRHQRGLLGTRRSSNN